MLTRNDLIKHVKERQELAGNTIRTLAITGATMFTPDVNRLRERAHSLVDTVFGPKEEPKSQRNSITRSWVVNPDTGALVVVHTDRHNQVAYSVEGGNNTPENQQACTTAPVTATKVEPTREASTREEDLGVPPNPPASPGSVRSSVRSSQR